MSESRQTMLFMNAHRLLARGEAELALVGQGEGAREDFLHSHMAALRGAAAIVDLFSVEAKQSRRRKVRSVWEQLAALEQWRSWAVYYAQSAQVRSALESGRSFELSRADRDQAVAMAADFLSAVRAAIEAEEGQVLSARRIAS